jgi:S1-C subfamily serine protease
MQRHLSMSKRGPLIWSLTLVATHVPAALAQGESQSPWTDERANALVRIEAPVDNEPSSVATGFIVDGLGGRQYVATSTHGLLPELTEEQAQELPAADCTPLPDGTKLFQGNRGGPELQPRCAYHIGYDVSLVELHPGTSRLPALRFLACNLVAGDPIYLGGFPIGGDRDTTLVGQVRGNGPPPMILGNFMTASGLSGGPYLTADGNVVAVHRGGARFTAGYAHMVPAWAVRTKLEVQLPQLKTSDECPKPVAHAVTGNEVAALSQQLAGVLGVKIGDSPGMTFDQRIRELERIITGLRNEIQWGMNLDDRPGAGHVVTIYYRRLVGGDEPPPADSMVLTVTPVTNPPVRLADPEEVVYSGDHIEEISGKSGKYETFVNSALKLLASKNNISFDTANIALRFRNRDDILATTQIRFSSPFTP